MSEQLTDKTTANETNQRDAQHILNESRALTREIVDIYYAQTFSQGNLTTASAVCKTFSEIIERYWNICCLAIFLRGDDGRLHEIAVNTDEYVDEKVLHKIGALMTEAVEAGRDELQVWLDQEEAEQPASPPLLREALKEAGLGAALCVPVYTHGEIVGALIIVTPFSDRLRAALDGLRYIAAPIVIAVGNAQRAEVMREQHHRIKHLVEELQQRSQDLEEANRELRRVAHYRSLFLARMSHELRTPLTSILGFTEILLDQEKLTETQQRFCMKIQSSGRQLHTSLNHLVDLSRLEAGHNELFLHEFSLREALRESCAAVARLAHKQSVGVECHSSPNLTPIVSDEGKLRQVFYNFLAYAISRSPEGSSILVRAENIEPSRFSITIEDEGEPLLDMGHLFEPIDICVPTEHATSMTELGLFIARRLIDVLSGSVKLENRLPQGLKVTIELPARPTEQQGSKREG
ncbi:MAG TPA: GAF domain-containing sensor histidine kinase [Pyrinomonadaceae bacterium]|jgi:signal transduction histidine kinase